MVEARCGCEMTTMGTASVDRQRHERSRVVRARTLRVRRLLQRDIERFMDVNPEPNYWRPQTRADCESVDRPCPYVGCKYNLYCDVTDRGNIKLNFPDLDPCDMVKSCVLDIAEMEGLTLEEVAEAMNITRERARQIEDVAVCRFIAEYPYDIAEELDE